MNRRQKKHRLAAIVGALIGAALAVTDAGAVDEAALKKRLALPAGFSINVYADDLGRARLMQLAPAGHMYVSVPNEGAVKLLRPDRDGDGRADAVRTAASGLDSPHGLWLDGSTLYVAEESRVSAFRADPQTGRLSGRRTVLKGLPAGGGHWTRTIKKAPDGWFYVTAGSSCNVCIERHRFRAAMIRFRPGGEPELFATGLRNTVGFDWRPVTGALYGVDNGRDWLGDDFPPDELNRIEKGNFYGWPLFNGDNVPDPDFGTRADAATADPVPPAYAFNAHVAPLSIVFLEHARARAYEGAALVAQHGSWNRSTKIGYRVVSLHWAGDGTITLKPFIEGFERRGRVIGRPVDVIEAKDGTIYVSDDYAGAVYRVTYRGG